MIRKAKNVIFIPSYRCVNNCAYCFQIHKAERLSVEDEIALVDKLFAELLTRPEFVEYGINIELMGGEYLLSSYESIKYIIDKTRKLRGFYDIQLEIQSTLTVQDDDKYKLLIDNKDLFHRIGTTIDVPFFLHKKNRTNDLDLVLKRIKQFNDNDYHILVFHGLNNEVAENLDEMKKDLWYLNDNYNIASTFINIFSQNYTMTSENQKRVVNYLFDNDMEYMLLRNNHVNTNKDFMELVADGIIKLCDHQPICQIHSFYNGKLYNNCDRISHQMNFAPQVFKPILKDIEDQNCIDCKWFSACYGGCPAQRIDGKYAFCEFRKAFLENIEQKYNVNIYDIIQKKLQEIVKK